MAYPAYVREKARELRRAKKLTIDELAERLAVPRTTVYYWVRDLPIPASGPGGGFSDAARRKGNRAMKAKYKRLRDEAYELGRWEFPRLARDVTFRDFVCLYIAEGYKRSRNSVQIANSDPAVIKLGAKWIGYFSSRRLDCSVQYHADQNLDELKRFWSAELGIEPESISLQRKSNSSQLRFRQWRCRHGVLAVRVHDTRLRARLQGWIDSMKEQWLDSLRVGV